MSDLVLLLGAQMPRIEPYSPLSHGIPRVDDRRTVFRRARLDGVPQRQIADELGVSLSTMESDLRIAARALVAVKERVR